MKVLWEALCGMFEHDRSAARGEMATRELIVFKHEKPLGNAPAHELFDRVKVSKKKDVDVARDYSDYTVTVNDKDLPVGVTILRPCHK